MPGDDTLGSRTLDDDTVEQAGRPIRTAFLKRTTKAIETVEKPESKSVVEPPAESVLTPVVGTPVYVSESDVLRAIDLFLLLPANVRGDLIVALASDAGFSPRGNLDGSAYVWNTTQSHAQNMWNWWRLIVARDDVAQYDSASWPRVRHDDAHDMQRAVTEYLLLQMLRNDFVDHDAPRGDAARNSAEGMVPTGHVQRIPDLFVRIVQTEATRRNILGPSSGISPADGASPFSVRKAPKKFEPVTEKVKPDAEPRPVASVVGIPVVTSEADVNRAVELFLLMPGDIRGDIITTIASDAGFSPRVRIRGGAYAWDSSASTPQNAWNQWKTDSVNDDAARTDSLRFGSVRRDDATDLRRFLSHFYLVAMLRSDPAYRDMVVSGEMPRTTDLFIRVVGIEAVRRGIVAPARGIDDLVATIANKLAPTSKDKQRSPSYVSKQPAPAVGSVVHVSDADVNRAVELLVQMPTDVRDALIMTIAGSAGFSPRVRLASDSSYAWDSGVPVFQNAWNKWRTEIVNDESSRADSRVTVGVTRDDAADMRRYLSRFYLGNMLKNNPTYRDMVIGGEMVRIPDLFVRIVLSEAARRGTTLPASGITVPLQETKMYDYDTLDLRTLDDDVISPAGALKPGVGGSKTSRPVGVGKMPSVAVPSGVNLDDCAAKFEALIPARQAWVLRKSTSEDVRPGVGLDNWLRGLRPVAQALRRNQAIGRRGGAGLDVEWFCIAVDVALCFQRYMALSLDAKVRCWGVLFIDQLFGGGRSMLRAFAEGSSDWDDLNGRASMPSLSENAFSILVGRGPTEETFGSFDPVAFCRQVNIEYGNADVALREQIPNPAPAKGLDDNVHPGGVLPGVGHPQDVLTIGEDPRKKIGLVPKQQVDVASVNREFGPAWALWSTLTVLQRDRVIRQAMSRGVLPWLYHDPRESNQWILRTEPGQYGNQFTIDWTIDLAMSQGILGFVRDHSIPLLAYTETFRPFVRWLMSTEGQTVTRIATLGFSR